MKLPGDEVNIKTIIRQIISEESCNFYQKENCRWKRAVKHFTLKLLELIASSQKQQKNPVVNCASAMQFYFILLVVIDVKKNVDFRTCPTIFHETVILAKSFLDLVLTLVDWHMDWRSRTSQMCIRTFTKAYYSPISSNRYFIMILINIAINVQLAVWLHIFTQLNTITFCPLEATSRQCK